MGTVKQSNIKNRTYYSYNDIIDLENFDSSLWKLTIKKIGDCKNIYSVNPLYLRISHASGYIKEENENKYLIFDSMKLHSIDKSKELLKKYNDVFNGIMG